MSKKQPQLIAYCVKNRAEGQTAIWTKVGAAWAHAGKPGFSIELDALPVDGRLVLIEPRETGAGADSGVE
jgi:hypothetical protein